MNLTIKSITLIDLSNREAKKIQFSPSKNMITSRGNHYGKSVIMKSIYYTLGAEVYFPNPIKVLNYLTSVEFQIDEEQYKVCRFHNAFILFHNSQFVDKYNSVGDFGEALSNLFAFEINLVGKDESGSINKCPPAFYYLPYYIDQENGWAANSYSFDRMTQFDLPQRKDSYFFHLGVLDDEFVKKSKLQKVNERRITKLTQDNQKYKTVIETLRMGLDATQMSFNVESLESAIESRKDEINSILRDIAQIRDSLVETEDDYFQLVNEKEILSKYIKKKQPKEILEETNTVECPRCGFFFEQSISQKLEKIYLLESLNDDYIRISVEIEKFDKKIRKMKTKFEERQTLLHNFEKSLGEDQDLYDTYLKSKTTKKLLIEYQEKIRENNDVIDELSENNKTIRGELKGYQDNRQAANSIYLNILWKQLAGLDVPKGQVEEKSEPGTALIASGAYGPRCKIAQMLSFLETQKEVSADVISFPVVIDSPNVLEQDREHLETVLQTLLTWNKTENQIIVASIEGKDVAESIEGVNVITLENEKNHLMTKEEYELYELDINEIITCF